MSVPAIRLSLDAFLDWEATQPERHEYVRGEVFAMTGASDRHNLVAGNLYMLLRTHLRGSPCQVFISDMKVRVDAADAIFYPDLLVTCSASDRSDRLAKRDPVVIVEVLSPSTAGYDLSAKFAHYRRLASLQEYVTIDPDAPLVQVFRRSPDGWTLHAAEAGDTVGFASIDLCVPIAAVYEDVRFEPPADGGSRA
ncbi:MAG TPA: Uma2 family endonuclease [Plasticicumulans sp.]|nr:Uma2 family endonuclease [Plasticicumulans sp.]HND98533.1 Uma2 family endonuclease [Plasticicumulans sp.]HNI23124.1 Uma2 family endonuclease [Plasticicumulans sp.]